MILVGRKKYKLTKVGGGATNGKDSVNPYMVKIIVVVAVVVVAVVIVVVVVVVVVVVGIWPFGVVGRGDCVPFLCSFQLYHNGGYNSLRNSSCIPI